MAENTHTSDPQNSAVERGTPLEVLRIFFGLGCTSFGGPVAHIGYFRDAFVSRKKWMTEEVYADIVALCQFMPGPASSQVGMAIGLRRAGFLGMLAAWVGFTLPSALLLFGFALGVLEFADQLGTGWIAGLKAVAVAVVAQAVWGMAGTLAPDKPRATIAVAAAVALVVMPEIWMQMAVIVAGGLVGFILPPTDKKGAGQDMGIVVPKPIAVSCLIAFFALLFGLPILVQMTSDQALALTDAFYRAGALVFGGGHVVLPLLESSVVGPGWMDQDTFLAGYGAAQAVPGPLFTLSAYLGTALSPEPNGWQGASIALLAMFLPSFLLVLGLLPFWQDLRKAPTAARMLTGVNAAVVGLLAAALYSPVWTSAANGPKEVAFIFAAFLALHIWKLPPWAVVIAGGVLGGFLL